MLKYFILSNGDIRWSSTVFMEINYWGKGLIRFLWHSDHAFSVNLSPTYRIGMRLFHGNLQTSSFGRQNFKQFICCYRLVDDGWMPLSFLGVLRSGKSSWACSTIGRSEDNAFLPWTSPLTSRVLSGLISVQEVMEFPEKKVTLPETRGLRTRFVSENMTESSMFDSVSCHMSYFYE